MATRFVRVDLSEEARDYRPIAVEPGVPMLDRSGANARIIFRWLGGMVAEPVWEDDLVGFYVRDDQGGRLEDVYCQPVSPQDLQGSLRDDLAKLRQRIEQARGETSTERTLRKVLMKSFQDVVDKPGRTDQDSYFFKYKDVLGNWRLIWCWGYERLDQEPAPAVVCTDPDCNLLFVRRPGKSPRCPACSGTIVPRKKKRSKRSYAVLLLLLLLLLLGLGIWRPWQPPLIAAPTEYSGAVGTHTDYKVYAKGLFGRKDVTHEATGISLDKQVAKIDGGTIRFTGEGTTQLQFHYRGHIATAAATATASPDADKMVSLELTPAEPVNLPLGQMMRLQAFANYGDGRRVQLPSERLKWSCQEKSVPGLELYRDSEVVGAVGATKSGAGPLNVYATYRGQESNHVAFKSVEADPNVKLAIDVDRTLRIAGEGGRAVLTASTPRGDVELIPSLAKFDSASSKVLKFAGKPGMFAAMSPGRSMVTGSHIAAKEPTKLEFQVCDPAKAKLVFDPPSVTVPVNEKADMRLMLEGELDEGGKKEKLRAAMIGPDVAYSMAQPDAVRLNPPTLTGLKPAAAFPVRGQIPILPPANATVTVVDAAAKKLRISPSAASPLAAGQSSALIVEQQVGDSEGWKEVSPDKVSWKVPDDIKNGFWTDPTENLRPTIKLPPDLKGEANLTATVGGATASVAFALKPAGPEATDARLVLDREATGTFLQVGQSQRYSVLVDNDGHNEPATEVHWPENFDNDYVKWEAPVLTAKREGYTQYLHANVAGRNVLWHTTTYRPGEFPGQEAGPKPDWVKIFSQQGSLQVQSVRFPVGATFTDFKVEVHYPDGYTRFVTKKALLTTPDSPATAPLAADHGKLTGLRLGKTKISAEFQGIVSKEPLEAEVLADVDIDRIAVEPGSAALMPGETYDLHAIGYKNGQSVGDITGLGNLTWKSSNPDVGRVAGNSVIASNLGETQVTVERKGLTSAPAQVTVSKTLADDLRVVPGVIEMPQGSSLQFGSDVQVLRGNLDVSQQANVMPESPGIVEYNAATHSLTARNIGQVTIGVTAGDKLARAVVNVGPPPILAGKLVVEPGSLVLAAGQAERLSVYVETPAGERVDETGVALFRSGDSSIAAVDNGIARVKAMKPGKTNIVAVVAGMAAVSVPLEVTNDEIKELTAEPAKEEMAVGETKSLRVFGRADRSGVKEMFPQPDLKAAPRKPDVVDFNGDVVRGKAIGDDTIDVSWRDKLKLEVPAQVTANQIAGLQIDPKDSTINTGEGKTYEVSAMRGGNRVVLTERDGVQLNVTDPSVAVVATGNTVVSRAPGQTKVIATLGGEKAEATLNVTLAPPGGLPPGRTVVYDPYGSRVYIGDPMMSEIRPAGKVVALQWEPQLFQKGVQAMPQTAQLHRRYENGGFDDVSNDSSVQITTEPNPAIAKMEKVSGGWRITPVAPGVTKVAAKLGDLTAQMNVEINGDAAVAGQPITGTLILNPSTISLWSGETAVIGGAELDPGNGQPHFPAKVKITAPDNQGIVSADGDKITGRSAGDATVTVTAENGPSATMNVHVTPPDAISLNPPDNSLQPGQTVTPAVMARSADGTEVAVQAPIESLDKNVIDADPSAPGQFVAKSQGQTQLHAIYRGKEVFAKVSVAGQRFQSVKSSYNRGDKTMTVEVVAAPGEGELEYRVYEEGAAPKENWAANQPDGDARKATLVSDPLSGEQEERHMVIEARDKSTKSVQQYPLTLVRSVTYEQQNTPPPSQPQK